MYLRLIPIILVLFVVSTNAQYKVDKLPLPILSEVEMKTWPSDTIAEAVVLSDVGDSRFFITATNGLNIQFTRTTKIKILKEAGISYGNVQIMLYYDKQELETVYHVQGNVYNIVNGNIETTPFNTKLMYEEIVNNKWKAKKFALPNVKAGSLIEYTYSVITPFKFNLPDWQFQWEIPVVKSSYVVGVVPFYEYMFLFQGALKFSKQTHKEGTSEHRLGGTTFKEMFYEFEMTNVPAFRDEDFITSVEDNILKIDFQLSKFTDIYGVSQNVVSTWKELSRDMMKNQDFGKYLSVSERHFKNNIPITLSSDTLENLKLAVEYVKNQYRWNNDYRLLPSIKASDFELKKSGSSVEKNLFALGLLNAMGINAKPVLISTRSHGRIYSEYPFINAFNSVIIVASVNNSNILIDAADPYCPFGLLPLQCINNKGYIVDGKNSDNWVLLNNSKPSRSNYVVIQEPMPELDSISTDISISANNYEAMKLRKQCVNNLDEFKKTNYRNIQIDSFNIENLEDLNNQLKITSKGKMEIERAGNNIIIHPFNGMCETKNIFKSEKRNYPVDLTYAFQRIYSCTIVIPKGYKVSSNSGNTVVNNNVMQVMRDDKLLNDKLVINGSYMFSKAIYQPEDYELLKSTFGKMVVKLNSPIILSPIDEETTVQSKL